mmetsp:Transcript_3098/g.2676  ORF Transcript_3098/g.2676 Transcript_3098/m.2676 type:complete len:122 (+) Transcript_3098:1012-1377(+)
MSKEAVEASQEKVCSRLGIKIEEIDEIFKAFNPKSKDSLQYQKNLEKFMKTMGNKNDLKNSISTSAEAKNKFSEFATPRLVSKDPNFKTLDPQRQRALLALRNMGTTRRAGGTGDEQKTLG